MTKMFKERLNAYFKAKGLINEHYALQPHSYKIKWKVRAFMFN